MQTRPIKGTLPRLPKSQKIANKQKNWRTQRKIVAQNLMIVDLMRNDIGRVAVAGW
ncbi:chorismate-binding protein [Shigella flexneri]